jgi:hypothetical protein
MKRSLLFVSLLSLVSLQAEEIALNVQASPACESSVCTQVCMDNCACDLNVCVTPEKDNCAKVTCTMTKAEDKCMMHEFSCMVMFGDSCVMTINEGSAEQMVYRINLMPSEECCVTVASKAPAAAAPCMEMQACPAVECPSMEKSAECCTTTCN